MEDMTYDEWQAEMDAIVARMEGYQFDYNLSDRMCKIDTRFQDWWTRNGNEPYPIDLRSIFRVHYTYLLSDGTRVAVVSGTGENRYWNSIPVPLEYVTLFG